MSKKKTRNHQQQADFEIILRYGRDNRFFSLIRLPPNIWLQNPAFFFALYLTGVHFQGNLLHIGHAGR